MKGKIRVGIVGAGYAAAFHYKAYRRVVRIPLEVIGVTSITPERREAFARQRGIKAFGSLDELPEEVDVVDNCNPGYAHEPVTVRALEHGRHVIVEKPFTGCYGPKDK